MGFADNLYEADNGIYYTMEYIAEWWEKVSVNPFIWDKKRKGSRYLRLPCAFDTETTNWIAYREYNKITHNYEPVYRATMYSWGFGLNGAVILGRTWTEFQSLVLWLKDKLCLGIERQIVCYVHNLDFDSQFFRKWFSIVNVFALEERKPMSITIAEGIIFKCSYILTGKKLESLADDLRKYKVVKKVGDLDYNLIRHSGTPITDKERGYIINDLLVIMAYIQEQIEKEGKIISIPLTKTGYVRRLYRDRTLYPVMQDGKADKIARMRYVEKMKNLTLTPFEYLESKKAYAGGYTHASIWHSHELRYNVASFDFSSSYPACMVCKTFPMSKGQLVNIDDKEIFNQYRTTHHCIFTAEFTDIEPSFPYEHYISYSKCALCEGGMTDNGRLISAEKIIITITELDYEIIEKTYKWESIRIANFYAYNKGYLPKPYVETTLEMYGKKTTLKGVEEAEAEYILSKEMVNSAYGMMVTDICRNEISYDCGEWISILPDIDKNITDYNESPTRFLSYLWGVYVCAWARHNLWFGGILKCGEDYIYSDTDSIKIMNYEKHIDDIMAYNKQVDKQMKAVCKHYKLDYALTRPKTIKGIEKPLGHWDFEGIYSRFKTLGCKRYLTEKDGKLSLTCAGVGKKNGMEYLQAKFKTADKIFEAFTDGLFFPPESDVKGFDKSPTGKLTHRYIDEETRGVLTDYLGTTAEYYEKSSITLEPAGYDLSCTAEYLMLLQGFAIETE